MGTWLFHTPKISFYKLENPEIFDFGKAMQMGCIQRKSKEINIIH
jgi:hypothetical protein